jgi:hypothetical protein
MDALVALGGIGSAFGLSSSAGLNAYIPLLIVALAGRFPASDPIIKLAEPYDILANGWVIAVLAVLLLIEMTVDKIPVADSANDVIQTFVRPAAGAILFAASADVITDMSPILAAIAGILVAGSVHAAKATVRPAVTATTVGMGNWVVSIAEDVIAFFVSVLTVLLPVLGLVFVVLFALVVYRLLGRRPRKPRGAEKGL